MNMQQPVMYPRGHRGHGPSLSALRGPLRPQNIFQHWTKRLLGIKIDIKVPFMCPWLPEGPPGTQWAPAVIRGHPDFWATGRLGGPGSRESLIAWGPLVTSGAPGAG